MPPAPVRPAVSMVVGLPVVRAVTKVRVVEQPIFAQPHHSMTELRLLPEAVVPVDSLAEQVEPEAAHPVLQESVVRVRVDLAHRKAPEVTADLQMEVPGELPVALESAAPEAQVQPRAVAAAEAATTVAVVGALTSMAAALTAEVVAVAHPGITRHLPHR